MSGGGSGSSSKGTTVVNNQDPWSGQQPYLTDIYSKAQTAYGNTPKDSYQGDLIAGPSQTQQQTNNLAFGAGSNAYSQGLSLANAGLDKTMAELSRANPTALGQPGTAMTGMNMAYLSPEANPNLMPALEAQTRMLTNRAREDMLPQVGGAAWNSGAYGGTAHGAAAARSMRDVQDATAANVSNALANIWNQAYTTERGIEASQQSQLDAQNSTRNNLMAQLAPTLFGQGISTLGGGLQTMQAAGETEQGWRQDLIDQNIAKINDARNAPWLGMDNYVAAIGGALPGSSTQSTYSPRTSTFSNFLGGALGGATAGYGLGNLFGYGGYGALAGGVAGGLGGLFG